MRFLDYCTANSIPAPTLYFEKGLGYYDATTGGNAITTDGKAVKRWESQVGSTHMIQAVDGKCGVYDAVKNCLQMPVAQGLDQNRSLTCTTTNGSNVATTASGYAGAMVGAFVSGTGIPAGTYVTSAINNTSITFNNNATADGTVTLAFAFYRRGYTLSTALYVSYQNYSLMLIGEPSSLRGDYATAAGAPHYHSVFAQENYAIDASIGLEGAYVGMLGWGSGSFVARGTTRTHNDVNMMAWVSGSTYVKTCVDGVTQTTNTAVANGGNHNNNYFFSGDLTDDAHNYWGGYNGSAQDVALWVGTKLTDAQLTLIQAWAAANRGCIGSAFNQQVVVDGDSISDGFNALVNRSFAMQFLPSKTRKRCTGLSGVRISTLGTNAATELDPLIEAGKDNHLFIFAGTNDEFNSASAATILADTKTYGNARKTAGWNKVTIVGMLPRSTLGTPTGTAQDITKENTVRGPLRTSLLADFDATGHPLVYKAKAGTTYADYYICLGGVALNDGAYPSGGEASIGNFYSAGVQAGQSNQTYYFDAIHPTAAGHAIIKSYYDAVYALIVAVTAPTLTLGTATTTTQPMSWTAATGGATAVSYSYQVQNCLDGYSWANAGAATSGTSATITGLTPGTLYHWRVIATDDNGTVATSGEGTATTKASGGLVFAETLHGVFGLVFK